MSKWVILKVLDNVDEESIIHLYPLDLCE